VIEKKKKKIVALGKNSHARGDVARKTISIRGRGARSEGGGRSTQKTGRKKDAPREPYATLTNGEGFEHRQPCKKRFAPGKIVLPIKM